MTARWLRNAPIHRKLIVITLLATTAALTGALGVFLAVQVKLARDNVAEDLQALAEVVADNAAGPLAFGDTAAATATLASLRARSDIEGGRLLGPTGGGTRRRRVRQRFRPS